jgi:hypothetical protein
MKRVLLTTFMWATILLAVLSDHMNNSEAVSYQNEIANTNMGLAVLQFVEARCHQ